MEIRTTKTVDGKKVVRIWIDETPTKDNPIKGINEDKKAFSYRDPGNPLNANEPLNPRNKK